MYSIGIPYFDTIRETLFRSLTLVDSPCQHIDGYSKPEIEVQNSKELLLEPIELRRNELERVVIERSLNSARINVQLKRVGDLETWLRSKRIGFMLQRADQMDIIRRKPVPGFDISFLVTAKHLQIFDKEALISFIITVIMELAAVNDLKRLISSRGRISYLVYLQGVGDVRLAHLET